MAIDDLFLRQKSKLRLLTVQFKDNVALAHQLLVCLSNAENS